MKNKRLLKQQYLETKTRAGVYAVRNLVTGRMLVAAGKDAQGALNRHRFELRQGSHRNRRLGQDWAQHGESSFAFDILDVFKPSEDAALDIERELKDLLGLWRQEMACEGERDYEWSGRSS